MAPIAAVLCGKQPKMSEFMIKALAPKIQVIHVCTTTETATTEIPGLLSGNPTAPSSGLGSNASSDAPLRTDISLIIIGGGYTKSDVDAIQQATDAVKKLPIFWADVSKTVGQGPPSPEVVKQRILEGVKREEKGEGGWEVGVHMY